MGANTSVLITGAAGFLGRHFLRYHRDQGHSVIAIDDFSNSVPLPDIAIARADAAEFIRDLPGPIDLAYHFAAPVGGRVKIEGDPLFNADSLRLDSAFFRWAVGKVGIVIYPSSSAVYGVSYQGSLIHQVLHEGLFRPSLLSWPAPDEMYGFTKMAGEMLAWKAAGYGLNTLCIRPFSGYGPGQGMEYPVPAILARAKAREDPLTVWGSGHQARDFVFISDLVDATIARLNSGVHGYQTMNIGTGEATSFRTVASMAAGIVGYDPMIASDESKPVGVATRVSDPALMKMFYQPKVSLAQGLAAVLDAQ